MSATSPFVPAGQPITWERIDQGQDLRTSPGGAIVAPWDGTVSLAPSNPGGFGTHYALYHVTSGPQAGKTFYIGHAFAVASGKIKAGQQISRTGTGNESWMGNAKGIPGHVEIGLWPPGSMSAGNAVASIVKGASAPASTSSSTSSSSDSGGGGFSVADLADPGKFAGDVMNTILHPIEQSALKMLLYVVLIGGGVAVAVSGALRATKGPPGPRRPPDPTNPLEAV